MQFLKVRNVKSPERNVKENAGIDLYVPEKNDLFFRDIFYQNKKEGFALMCGEGEFVISHIKAQDVSFLDQESGIIYIAPHKDILIPMGIKSKFDSNIALIACNESSVARKKKLIFGAQVIDSSYQGEWFVHLINTSSDYQQILCGEKIIQVIPYFISQDDITIFKGDPNSFYDSKTLRGDGCLGSTGTK